MTNRPDTWAQCWRHARANGYERNLTGWLRAWSDLARAAHPLRWGVPPSTAEQVAREARELA